MGRFTFRTRTRRRGPHRLATAAAWAGVAAASLCAAGCGSSDEEIVKLASSNVAVRYKAVVTVAEDDDTNAVPGLIALTDETQPHDIREKAIWALGELKDSRSVDRLSKLLLDPDADMREAAAEALAKVDDTNAVPALLSALEDKDVRLTAIWALGQLGDERAVPPLTSLLQHDDQYVRYNAKQALKQLDRDD